jgi:hypothetical protein
MMWEAGMPVRSLAMLLASFTIEALIESASTETMATDSLPLLNTTAVASRGS